MLLPEHNTVDNHLILFIKAVQTRGGHVMSAETNGNFFPLFEALCLQTEGRIDDCFQLGKCPFALALSPLWCEIPLSRITKWSLFFLSVCSLN